MAQLVSEDQGVEVRGHKLQLIVFLVVALPECVYENVLEVNAYQNPSIVVVEGVPEIDCCNLSKLGDVENCKLERRPMLPNRRILTLFLGIRVVHQQKIGLDQEIVLNICADTNFHDFLSLGGWV